MGLTDPYLPSWDYSKSNNSQTPANLQLLALTCANNLVSTLGATSESVEEI